MYFSYRAHNDVYFITCKSQSNSQIFNLRRHFQIAPFRVLLNKALQVLKENLDDHKKTFFKTTNFPRFNFCLFNLFSPQLNDQIDSDSVFNTVIPHLLDENHSLDTFHEHKNEDAGGIKKKVINVFTQNRIQ